MTATADTRPARFAAMYEARYGALHAYAARRAGLEAADEIAAETFLVAWRRFDELPPEPLPWLYGVARNMVLRHYEATARRRAAEQALEHERPAAADARDAWAGLHAGSENDPRLWDAWQQLREADREVLGLIAWEELSVADAARAIGCSGPVFSVRLHRARRRLERLLAASASHPSPELSEAA